MVSNLLIHCTNLELADECCQKISSIGCHHYPVLKYMKLQERTSYSEHAQQTNSKSLQAISQQLATSWLPISFSSMADYC